MTERARHIRLCSKDCLIGFVPTTVYSGNCMAACLTTKCMVSTVKKFLQHSVRLCQISSCFCVRKWVYRPCFSTRIQQLSLKTRSSCCLICSVWVSIASEPESNMHCIALVSVFAQRCCAEIQSGFVQSCLTFVNKHFLKPQHSAQHFVITHLGMNYSIRPVNGNMCSGFFPCCKDFGGRFTNSLPVLFFLKWRSARAHSFDCWR